MSGTERISDVDGLTAWMRGLAGGSGTPADFEAAVRSGASRMDVRLGWQPLLSLARIGWTRYAGLPDLPLEGAPSFLGRPVDSLTAASRRDEPRLRVDAGPDERFTAYGEYLSEDLEQWLDEHGVPEPPLDLARVLAAYLSAVGLHRGVGLGGWDRPLDAHAFGMLAAERALRYLDPPAVEADLETACFRWLQLVAYADLPPDHLEEMLARRAVRLDHSRHPAGAVATMTCETSPSGGVSFDAVLTRAHEAALTPEQVTALYTRLADREAPELRARAAGFADTERLDLTPAAFDREHHDDHATGHLVRWMVDHDVPVRPLRLSWAGSYTVAVVLYLVRHPVTKEKTVDTGRAHLRAVHLLRKRAGSIPLAEELILLSWLLAQRGGSMTLGGLVAQRDSWLERLAAESSG